MRAKKYLSMLLVVVMMLSLFPVNAFALGGGSDIGIGGGFGRDIGDDEIRDFDPSNLIEDAEEPVDLFSGVDTENGIQVTVESRNNALPTMAEVRVTPVDPDSVREAVAAVVDGQPNVLVAMDISFWLDGIEVEPEEPVNVKISAPELTDRTGLQVVHIPDADGEEEAQPNTVELIGEEEMSIPVGTNEIAFKADSFSVYAIVDDGTTTADNGYRRTYKFEDAEGNPFEFYNNAGDKVDNQIIKSGEYLEDVGLPVISASQTFLGWFIYDKETGTYGDQILFGAGHEITFSEEEDVTLFVRPKYNNVYYVTFYNDADGRVVLDRQQVVVVTDGDTTVDISAKEATPPDNQKAFVGWTLTKGGTDEITTDEITITGNTELYPVFKQSRWISYYTAMTGAGATFVPSSFVLVGHKANENNPPEVTPTVKGYTFKYWTAVDQSANWEKVTDEETGKVTYRYNVPETAPAKFDFDQYINDDITLYAYWEDASTGYAVLFWRQVLTDDYDTETKHYEFVAQEERTADARSTVQPEPGDLNRSTGDFEGCVYNADKSDTEVVVDPDGTTKLNIYYDRKVITMNFSNGGEYVEVPNDDNEGEQFGTYYGYRVKLTFNNGNWYFQDWYGDWQTYTGTRYRYVDNSFSYVGLYGQPLSHYDYEWPDGTWNYQATSGEKGMSYLGQFILPNDVADADKQVINFTKSNNDGISYIDFFLQETDGKTYPDTYNDRGTVGRGGTFYFSDKYDGFSVAQYRLYRVDNSGNRTYYTASISNNTINYTVSEDWIDCRPDTDDDSVVLQTYVPLSASSGYNTIYFNLEIRYARKDYTLKYVDSADPTKAILDPVQVYYEADLKDYKPAASVVPTSSVPGKVFSGKWYEDEACTKEFDWTKTMPMHEVIVYAGWEDVWYWIKIEPNGGVLPVSESTWFWETYGKTATEYADITRNFVEDASGTYYYHYDEFDTSKANPPADWTGSWDEWQEQNQPATRRAFYTENASDATDTAKKYKYEENAYSLLGWYKVNADGSLGQPYNFSSPITENLTLRAMWRRIGEFRVEYSARGVDENGEFLKDKEGNDVIGDDAPTDSNTYADNSDSAFMSACTAPQGYVFKGWYYKETVSNPGSVFKVDASLAVNKVITIYAVYEAIETVPVRVTHITWHANNGTDDSVTDDDLQLNANVAIRPSTQFSYYGHTFLGWARVDMNEDGEPAVDPATLTEADLFLKYDPAAEAGKQWLTEDGKVALYVAADEFTPYQDLYAVWGQEYFYVFHSSDCTVEKIAMPTSAETKYNLTTLVKGDYLYGGYYSDYGKKGDYDIENPAEFTSAVSNSTAYVGGVGPWKADNAITVKGTTMVPEANKTYFLKEVPSVFLKSLLYVVYDAKNNNTIVHNYLIADVDDNNYSNIGLYATSISTGNRIKLALSYSIVDTLNGKTDKINAATFGAAKGYVAVWKPDLATADFDFVPFFVTPDGVTVEGSNVRSISWGDGTYQEWSAPGVTFSDAANDKIGEHGNVSTRS